ncbi:MAG: GNAT family N-acetyltransferase [Ruminiclostridium sp.]|nr:GNAT family N-acetyltransferase [Ruminiclostridium sp.]
MEDSTTSPVCHSAVGIRYVSRDDDPLTISDIYEKSWKYAYKDIIPQSYLDSIPTGRWAGRISNNGMNSLVLLLNGTIIGTAGLCGSRWERFADHGEIVSIYFLPEYMGKGYGTLLLKRCIEELNRLGYDRILLWVLEDNIRARKFYERNGFAFTGEYMTDNIGGKELREMMYSYRTGTGTADKKN